MENKIEPKKSHFINFTQRKVIKETLIATYEQPMKITQSVEFLGVDSDSHLKTELHVEHIERASHISRMKITRLNSISAT